MRLVIVALLSVAAACGQALNAPVIYPRGVTDATRQDAAPATVARGGLLQISGFNFGTDPKAVVVSINGEAATVVSIVDSKIVAQVPVAAAIGVASVTVTANGATTAPQVFTVAAVQPGIVTKDGSGYGLAAGSFAKSPITVTGTGYGAANPRAGTVLAYVGGSPAKVTTTESKTDPGIFDTVVTVPGTARPGDLLYVSVNGKAANPVLLQPLTAPDVQFLKLTAGSPDLAQISTPDVNGQYILGTAAKDAKNCFAAFTYDFTKKAAAASNPCLAAPFVASAGTEYVAALLGPDMKQVLLVTPGSADKTADLTGVASTLAAGALGTFTAQIPAVTGGAAASVDTITASTGVVKNAPAPAGGGGGAPGAAVPISVDGLTKSLTARVTIPGSGGNFAIVLGDANPNPTRVEFAILKTNGDKVSAASLPSGLVPLEAPQSNTGLAFYHAATKSIYVAAKMPDDSLHAFVAFPVDGSSPNVVKLPDGWFIAACTNALRTYPFVLSQQLGIFASKSSENTFKAACPSSGFLEIDQAKGSISAVALPAGSDMVVGSAIGTFDDFLYGTNLSPTARTASAVFALDGAGGSTLRLDLPQGLNAIQAPTTIPVLDALVALGQKRAAGDQGLVFFDLVNATSKSFALPDGFVTVSVVGVFPATRKLVARGISTDRKTSNLVIYDLLTGTPTVVANPDGVASVAAKPGAAANTKLLVANASANTVSAVAYAADGSQVGVMTVRVP